MSDPRACWAPAPKRPIVKLALVRQFKYVYGTVSPQDGSFDHMITDMMNTENMSKFLRRVSNAHKNKFAVMIVDGASSHRCKDLVVPDNIALIQLPPYSPELNPAERVWNLLRRDYIANKYFETLEEAMVQTTQGLADFKSNKKKMKSLTCWPWISRILNAF
jgi:transposase